MKRIEFILCLLFISTVIFAQKECFRYAILLHITLVIFYRQFLFSFHLLIQHRFVLLQHSCE